MRLLPLLLVACAWEAPLDPDADPVANSIAGNVVLSSADRGATTYVLLFDAADPGPPAGTGSPVSFVAVPPTAFTGPDQGMQSAPFTLTGVADGDWLLTALMDRDGDFNPFASGLAGATCGDVTGAHLDDLVSQQPVPVSVRGGELLQGVPVLLGGPVASERPAFTVPQQATVSRATLASSIGPDGLPVAENVQQLQLSAVGIAAAYDRELVLELDGPCVPDPDCDTLLTCACAPTEAPCLTALPLWLVDDDGDGAVDPYPAEPQASSGLGDVWPRVYLEYLGTPVNDPDAGVVFDSGLGTFRHRGEELPERWVSEAFPLAAELQVTSAKQLPVELAIGPVGVPVDHPTLPVTLSPIFRHYHRGGAAGVDVNGPFDLVNVADPAVSAEAVPAGTWSVTVVSRSGQTWTIPNELGLQGIPPVRDGYDPASQGRGVLFE